MIDEDLFYRLGDEGPAAAPRPMIDIAARARQVRARRRRGRVAIGVAALGLALAVAVPLSPLSPLIDRSQPLPASVGGKDCTDTEQHEKLSAHPELAYMVETGTKPGLAFPPVITRTVPDCPTPGAVGNWYSMSGTTVDRRLTVSGPGYPAPGRTIMAENRPGRVDLGDRTGLVVMETTARADGGEPLREGWLWWTEPDGTAWRADSAGMTRAELIAAVRSLEVDGARLDTGRLPAGLSDAVPAYTGPAQGPDEAAGSVGDLQAVFQPGEYLYWTLSVFEQRSSAWQAGYNTRAVSVGGKPGWGVVGPGEPGANEGTGGSDQQAVLTWQLAPGIAGRITCQCDLQEAVDLARATRKVAPDDPRVSTR